MSHPAAHPPAPCRTADADGDGAIAPRRPGRAAEHPQADMPEWRARPDSLPNLFLDLFTPDQADGLLSRGRHRIIAATRAREAAETPELVNLWHDAFAPHPTAPDNAVIANDVPPPAPDDLDRLHRMREALYAPDPDAPMPPARSVQMRLAVHAMNGTLVATAAPVGIAVMTYSLIRGEDLRLTTCAMIACGTVMAMLDLASPLI